jgi:hypothetical protein
LRDDSSDAMGWVPVARNTNPMKFDATGVAFSGPV